MESENSPINPQNIIVPSKSFEDLLKLHAKKTVGKILRRFEICDNKEVIKSQVKELLYESFRDLGDYIYALNDGLRITILEAGQRIQVIEGQTKGE